MHQEIKDIKTTIIVPVYNSQDYLHKCITSILEQSHKNLELILINDGSKDNSAQICDDYAKKDDRIIVIHQENSGVSVARNQGIEKASGDFIIYVDSDDWIQPEYVTDLLLNSSDPENELLWVGRSFVYPTHTDYVDWGNQTINIQDALANKEIAKNGFITAKLFNTKIIKNNNIRFKKNISYGEDWLFCMEYMKYVTHIKTIVNYNYMYNRDLRNTSLVAKRFKYEQYFELFNFANESINNIYENANDSRSTHLRYFIAKRYLLSAIKAMYRKDSYIHRKQRLVNLKTICDKFRNYIPFTKSKLLMSNNLVIFDIYYYTIFKLRYGIFQPLWNLYKRIK